MLQVVREIKSRKIDNEMEMVMVLGTYAETLEPETVPDWIFVYARNVQSGKQIHGEAGFDLDFSAFESAGEEFDSRHEYWVEKRDF